MSLPPHVENAAVVLDEVQLACVPVPKAGGTALEPVARAVRHRGARSRLLGTTHCRDARDREVFGYELVPRGLGEPDARWVADVEARIPVIQAVIERNERIGDLKRLISRRRVS
jgi:hypothetical protein